MPIPLAGSPDEAAQWRLRPARADEAEALSVLVLRSKAHWGYDAVFLAACADELRVTATTLATERVTVAEDGDVVVGLAALAGTDDTDAELTMLFVDPPAIGTGAGRTLFEHVVTTARTIGITRFRIEADPGAAPFYEAMGAVLVGTVASGSIAGRSLPVYSYATRRATRS